MKRFILTFAAVGLAMVVLGRWYAYRQLLAERRAEAAQREAVERALAKVISTHAFAGEEPTLEETLRGVARQCDVPLRVNRAAVAAGKQQRRVPIYIPRGNFTLEEVLDRIGEEFTIGWCRHRDGILITSWAEADKRTKPYTQVYPLPTGMAAGEIVSDDAAELSQLIATTFEPDQWDEVGGMGVIRPAGGAIVLHHRPEFHRRVQALLSNLQSPPADSRQAFSPEHWRASDEQRIFAALQEQDSIDFQDEPLEHVVKLLAARHGIKIVLAQTTLADAAISPDTPITKKLANVSLQTILREVLADLNLTYVVRDHVIQITTPEDAESVLVNRLYDVHDLAAPAGQGDFADLINLITTTIEPDSWDEVGGPGAIAPLCRRWLVVTQTQEIHEQIEPLLVQLRQILRPNGPGEVLISPQCLSAEVDRALDSEVMLSIRDKPLQQVCDWLADLLHVPVLLSKTPLEEAAVNVDTPVTIDLPPLPLRHALKIMLGDMALAFRTRGEVIHITTHDDVEGNLDIRLFDVRHLTSPGAGGIDERALAQLIRTGIRPGDWDEEGGPGSLTFFRGLLVVAQTDEVQQELRHLIDALSERLLPQTGDDVPQSFWIGRSRGEEEILARLEERDSLRVVNPDTEESVRMLCARHSIPVIFKKSCRVGADDEPRRHEALDFSGAPLHEILAKLLEKKRAGFIAWNGLLVITNAETAESQYQARLYPVGPRWPGDQKLRGQEVARLLAGRIELDSWEDVGGPAYAIPVNVEWLLVVQSLDVHRQIDELIAQLRAGQPLPELHD
jgi:hypothetical protein